MIISIIIPSFNQSQYLEKNFESILNQSFKEIELIVMDGGSNDGSLDIIKKYESHLMYWQSEKDGGQSAAINEGMRRATGEVVTWLNSDDQLAPNSLKTISEYFENNPKCEVLSGLGRRINVEGRELEVRGAEGLSFDEILRWKKYLPQSSCFFRKSLWDKVGGLDESLHFQMDFDLWLRFAQITSFHGIDEILSYDLHHDEAKTVSKSFHKKRLSEYILVLSKYSRERYEEEIGKFCSVYLKVQSVARFLSRFPGYNAFKRFVQK